MTTYFSGDTGADTIGSNTVSTTKIVDGAVTATKLAAGAARSNFGAGAVLQVVQAVKTDAQSTTSSSYVDITGLSVTITPTSATSKILVMARINNLSNSGAELVPINLLRGSTSIISSTAGGLADTNDAWITGGGGGMSNDNRKMTSGAIDYLDSPATTSATTYKMQMLSASGTTSTVNRWQINNDGASVSSITVMEIAA